MIKEIYNFFYDLINTLQYKIDGKNIKNTKIVI